MQRGRRNDVLVEVLSSLVHIFLLVIAGFRYVKSCSGKKALYQGKLVEVLRVPGGCRAAALQAERNLSPVGRSAWCEGQSKAW